jgi:hypothetical protein
LKTAKKIGQLTLVIRHWSFGISQLLLPVGLKIGANAQNPEQFQLLYG